MIDKQSFSVLQICHVYIFIYIYIYIYIIYYILYILYAICILLYVYILYIYYTYTILLYIYTYYIYHSHTHWSNLFGKLLLMNDFHSSLLAIKVLSSSICSPVSSMNRSIYVFFCFSILWHPKKQIVRNFFIISPYVSWKF